MNEEYLTVYDVARILKVSYDKALELIKYSGMEYVKIGRQYRVSPQKLNDYLYPQKTQKKTLRKRPIYQIVEAR